jgi:hypothetical protein
MPITAPLTFSSVDSNRAAAGTIGLLRMPAERYAAEVARGSYLHVSTDLMPWASFLRTALENREANIFAVGVRVAAVREEKLRWRRNQTLLQLGRRVLYVGKS